MSYTIRDNKKRLKLKTENCSAVQSPQSQCGCGAGTWNYGQKYSQKKWVFKVEVENVSRDGW